ncbi:SDR family oxidoreductase [Noviherbaspirillum galbum]|uniref:NAD(P)-dependent oxidoreductase n=1 Tax=Noviherbaspirillum galbum TaxID=2709383 RepID=A0A6B3SWA7_9BURK|nr:NAD(P)-dependent oxidoreductase [Noviherbaspirillum galbum]NEX63695.1 NAD(P)-dependent oxidoreductase [Noviherbaspirillum galbum]
MTSLKDKVLFITGASRGIGKAIALRAARDGARIVIAAKTAEPDPRLPGTIFSAAEDIEHAGGQALPVVVDVRDEAQVQAAVERAAERFGGIDILVNNASAISITGTAETPLKRYDLMMDINMRGTFACAQACLPYLKKAANPHVLVLSPPIDLDPKWLGPHPPYTASKYGMSLLALGMAEELRQSGIAVNGLWPRTIIATAALNVAKQGLAERGRTPEIMADAAYQILISDSRTCTGTLLLDEQVLREAGVSDFEQYSVTPGVAPQIDLFVNP